MVLKYGLTSLHSQPHLCNFPTFSFYCKWSDLLIKKSVGIILFLITLFGNTSIFEMFFPKASMIPYYPGFLCFKFSDCFFLIPLHECIFLSTLSVSVFFRFSSTISFHCKYVACMISFVFMILSPLSIWIMVA